MKNAKWSSWRDFPNPDAGDYLYAPFGSGCYQLRRKSTKQFILFGMGSHVAQRLTSLLPEPKGAGTRNNSKKRLYIEQHLADIEYITIAFATKQEAKDFEKNLKMDKDRYLFPT